MNAVLQNANVNFREKIVSWESLSKWRAQMREAGKRLVVTNGCFDLLHAGHLSSLRAARALGDVLIVGVNSDESVRSYKGPDRPIVDERRRAEMLLALRMVDYVHIFDETDPIAFLKEIKPDVHVNGSEYGENCIESETVKRGGGEIYIVNRIPGLSTSRLVDVLQSNVTANS